MRYILLLLFIFAAGCDQPRPCYATSHSIEGFKIINGNGREVTHCLPCAEAQSKEEIAVCRGFKETKMVVEQEKNMTYL